MIDPADPDSANGEGLALAPSTVARMATVMARSTTRSASGEPRATPPVPTAALDQLLVSFGEDKETGRVIDAVQRSGQCWMGGTNWHRRHLMRISVSNWHTTEADVDRSVAAILPGQRLCMAVAAGIARDGAEVARTLRVIVAVYILMMRCQRPSIRIATRGPRHSKGWEPVTNK